MAKRYYFGGNYFSEQDILDQATADGISVSSYLKQHPEIKEESISAGVTPTPMPKPEGIAKKMPKQDWEVDYEYDRSKGLRRKDQSYGKYIDNIAHGFVNKTFESFKSGTPGELSEEAMNIILMDEKERGKMTREDAIPILNAMRIAEQAPTSKAMREWVKTVDEADNPIYGFIQAMGKHGVEVAYEASISSMAGQAKAFWESPEIRTAAIAAGAAQSKFGGFNPYLRAAGFMRGMMSVLGGSVETASTFSELIKEQFGGRIPSEEEFIKFAQNEELFNEFRNKSLKKGLTIAAVDNFGGGMVVKSVAKTAKKGKKVRAVTKGIIGEAGVGATGEIAGSLIAKQKIQASAVGLEIIGQGPQAFVDIGGAIITPGSYKVNGKEASLREVNRILQTAKSDELAAIDIEIKNNSALEAEYRNKKNDAVLETQVDAKIGDEADRKRMVELEKQRVKAEKDTKKKGIQAVPGAEQALENIQNQMDEIVNKYIGVDARTKDVRARKKVAEQVRTEIADKAFSANLDFAKKHSALYGLKVDDTMTPKQIAKYIKDNNIDPDGINADGFIHKDKIIINKTVAKNTGAVNVGNHELLHGILRKAVKEGKINKNLISDLKTKLGESNWSKIEQRIKEAGYTSEYMSKNQDEYLTLLSDAIANNDITFNEGLFTKIGDLIKPVLRAFGFKKINFETADSTYEFLKEYNKSIHKGALSSAIVKATAGKVEVEGMKMSRSKAVEAVNEIEAGLKTRLKEQGKEYTKDEFQRSPEFNDLFESINLDGGAINSYIKSLGMSPAKTKATIESARNRLMGYDPQAKRKTDVKKEITIGERIMSDIGFAKLTAAKELAVEGKRKKKTVPLDDPDVKDIADKPAPTPTITEADKKDVKLRKLKDFNVELDSGLADALTIEAVNNLLDQYANGKITFKQAQAKMDELVAKDIRAELSKIVPKIAKNKKTGKVEPTPEYDAFIRNE